MPDPQSKKSPSSGEPRSFLPWVVIGFLLVLSLVVFSLNRKAENPAVSPPPDRNLPEASFRPVAFPTPPSERTFLPSASSPAPVTAADQSLSYVEPDPLLERLQTAFQQGECQELIRLVGAAAVEDEGLHRFYSSLLYSWGVSYWRQKDFLKAANYMKCLLTHYQDYRDEALLVLIESEIALGRKSEARIHLEELKRFFPRRRPEAEKFEPQLLP